MNNFIRIKIACTLCILCFCPAWALAQIEKNTQHTIVIGSFDYMQQEEEKTMPLGQILRKASKRILTKEMTQQHPQYAEAVGSSIISGFNRVKRLTVVDLINNLENDYYAEGVISNISTTTRLEKDKGNKTYYQANIGVTINLKEQATGRIFDSKKFTIVDNAQGWLSSSQSAIEYALTSLSQSISAYYDYVFPLRASIIESGEVKKDKQKTAYIDLGKTSRVNEGLRFGVFELKTIAGKEAQIEIGQVKIDQVLGDDLSLVRVTKGSKEIKAALDKGSKLVISTRY